MRKLLSLLLVIFLLAYFAPAAALAGDQAQEEQIELSLEDAVKRALGFSNAVEKAWISLDKADESRVPVAEYHYVSYSPEGEAAILAGESAKFAYDKARKELGLIKDEVVLNAYDNYFQCLRKQKELETKQLALEYANKEFAAANAMYNVGMMNKVGLDGMQTQVITAQNNYNAAELAVDNAFVSFNQMLGYKEDTRPVLVTIPEYAPWEKDLEMHITTVLHESPVLWTAGEAAEYMRSVANMDPGTTGMSAVTDEDAEMAKLDAEDARDATRLLVRSLYSTVKNLEDGYAAAEQGVAIARENLRIAELKYNLGMATKTQLLKAQLDLATAEQSLFDLVCQHKFMKQVLEKPWAYSMSQ